MLSTNRSEFWVCIKVIRRLGTNELKSCSMHIGAITWPTQIHPALMSPMSWGPKNLSWYKRSRKNLSCNMTTWRMMRVSKLLKSLESLRTAGKQSPEGKKGSCKLVETFSKNVPDLQGMQFYCGTWPGTIQLSGTLHSLRCFGFLSNKSSRRSFAQFEPWIFFEHLQISSQHQDILHWKFISRIYHLGSRCRSEPGWQQHHKCEKRGTWIG